MAMLLTYFCFWANFTASWFVVFLDFIILQKATIAQILGNLSLLH